MWKKKNIQEKKKQANTQPGAGENVVARTKRKRLDKNTTKHWMNQLWNDGRRSKRMDNGSFIFCQTRCRFVSEPRLWNKWDRMINWKTTARDFDNSLVVVSQAITVEEKKAKCSLVLLPFSVWYHCRVINFGVFEGGTLVVMAVCSLPFEILSGSGDRNARHVNAGRWQQNVSFNERKQRKRAGERLRKKRGSKNTKH